TASGSGAARTRADPAREVVSADRPARGGVHGQCGGRQRIRPLGRCPRKQPWLVSPFGESQLECCLNARLALRPSARPVLEEVWTSCLVDPSLRAAGFSRDWPF